MLTGYWRAINPIYQKSFAHQDLKNPIGNFADWAEFQTSSLTKTDWHLFGSTLFFGTSIGIGHMGKKGIRNIHAEIHRFTNNRPPPAYTNQINGMTLSYGNELHFIFNDTYEFFCNWKYKVKQGFFLSKMMDEFYTSANTYCNIYDYKLGFEGRIIKQINSNLYHRILPYRYELSTGFFIRDTIKLSLKYVSPFLKQDNVRQIYAGISFFIN